MSATQDLINEIKDSLSQKSASRKDEARIMQAMLNDKEYKVGIYSGAGVIEEYCPSADARAFVSSVLTDTVKISKSEADVLADKHEFTKQEATAIVNISKQFIHTYIETGRKLPLGGRELSNVSLSLKEVKARTKKYPMKSDVLDANGNAVYESVTSGEVVPAHNSIKVSGSCPSWVK